MVIIIIIRLAGKTARELSAASCASDIQADFVEQRVLLW